MRKVVTYAGLRVKHGCVKRLREIRAEILEGGDGCDEMDENEARRTANSESVETILLLDGDYLIEEHPELFEEV